MLILLENIFTFRWFSEKPETWFRNNSANCPELFRNDVINKIQFCSINNNNNSNEPWIDHFTCKMKMLILCHNFRLIPYFCVRADFRNQIYEIPCNNTIRNLGCVFCSIFDVFPLSASALGWNFLGIYLFNWKLTDLFHQKMALMTSNFFINLCDVKKGCSFYMPSYDSL